jgi:hypothetical protein
MMLFFEARWLGLLGLCCIIRICRLHVLLLDVYEYCSAVPITQPRTLRQDEHPLAGSRGEHEG